MNVLENASNTKQQGDIGVAAAMAYYAAKGCVVLTPLTDNARYDLVIERELKLYRVQCKTTKFQTKHGIYSVLTKTSGGNQSWNKISKYLSKEEIDLLFVLTDAGTMYEFPPEFFDGKGSMNLGKDKEKYKLGKLFEEFV